MELDIRFPAARRAALLLAGALLLGPTGCATRWAATRARFVDPSYVITSHFYEEAPQRLVVLPFATRGSKPDDRKQAEGCRRSFYQQIVLRDYEDVDLRRLDASVLPSGETNRLPVLGQVMDVVRRLDVMGMTTVLDLDSLFGKESLKYSDFMAMVRHTREQVKADAYVLGMTREYGRFYAIIYSSVGISTRVELRSAATGHLLWRGEMRKRNYELPLTINPLDIPRLLFDVWRNSRGRAMANLAYRVYGEMCSTMPYVPAPGPVFVEFEETNPGYYRKPTLWMFWAKGRVPGGTRMPFQMEQNGWFQCRTPEGKDVWVFNRSARLVDADGKLVDSHADLAW